jgi:hypothetical protein
VKGPHVQRAFLLPRLYPSALSPAPNGNQQVARVLTNTRNPTTEGSAMNQTIRQKQAILQVMRERVSMSTSEMYQMIGREEPVRAPRFNVIPLGGNKFDVVEHDTGVSRGARDGHDMACDYAKQLEQNADFFEGVRLTGSRFGRILLRWAIGCAVLLFVFAYFGAQQ